MSDLWRKVFVVGVLLIVVAAVVCHYHRLGDVPYGFHVDEGATAANILCHAQNGTDPRLVSHPVFADLYFSTPKPITHTYIGIAWVKLFGSSPASFRAYSVTAFLLCLPAIFLIVRFFVGTSAALWALVAAAISPWPWASSRLAFESFWMVPFVLWGAYLFFVARRWWMFAISGACFSVSMYSYPPARAFVPLFLPVLFFVRYKLGVFQKRMGAVFVAGLVIVSLPMAAQLTSRVVMDRLNDVRIDSPAYLSSIGKERTVPNVMGIFVQNMGAHFGFDYLFVRGDQDLRYSTRKSGVMGGFDMAALLMALALLFYYGLKKMWPGEDQLRSSYFILFCLAGLLVGVAPAAMTHEGTPHSLRSIGAWPFFMMLVGAVWAWGCDRLPRAGVLAGLVMAIVSGGYFVHVYFTSYPKTSFGMFQPWVRSTIDSVKTDEEWVKVRYILRRQDYDYQYYAMSLKGQSCVQAREEWTAFNELLHKMGKD